jgi:hydrogenase/urease accessory protein HupE
MIKYSDIINSAFLICFFLFSFSSGSNAQDSHTSAAHVGFFYPVSTHGKNAGLYTNAFSLHAIAGVSRGETGVAISGVNLLIKDSAKGVQVSGVSNVILNSAKGVQVAGVTNFIRHQAEGLQIAGMVNVSETSGAAQIAGFSNITHQSANGVQLSGFLNKAGNVNSQISGFMNIAKNVKGVQLAGLINVADSSDYPIGLLNFVKNGEKSIALTMDETSTLLASFRSGGRVLYGILGIGYNLKSDNKSLYGLEAGLGAHIAVSRKFRINAEIANLTLSDFKRGDYFKNSLRILPAFKITPKLELFGGPSLNYVNYSKGKGDGLVDHYLWKKKKGEDFQGLYLGFQAGLHFLL